MRLNRGVIKLVVTDLDGTLLRSDRTVSERTRQVVAAAEAAGVPVVPATARQRLGVLRLADQISFQRWALVSNGAVALDLSTGEVLAEATVDPSVQRAVAARVTVSVPDATFFAVWDAGSGFACEPAYRELAAFDDHVRPPAEMSTATLAELTSHPANKLGVRSPSLTGRELWERITALDLASEPGGVAPSHSGAAFVDFAPAGVSKAWGLSRLCDHLKIGADEVVAFGDEVNDTEMLAWAGTAVVMPSAPPEVLALADRVAPPNDEDGLAQVLAELLGMTEVLSVD